MRLILIIAAALALGGCSAREDGTDLFVQIRTIEGHKYIIYSNGGAGIIHAESCRCKGETK